MKVLSHLPIDVLRSFVTVKEHGGISSTAQVLSRSQPAISLQIKRLEDLLGQKLFMRRTQRFELTDSGVLLFDYAQRILSLNDEVFEQFADDGIGGRVRVGLPSEFAATLMPGIIGRFSRKYPDVSLEVSSELSVSLRKQFSSKSYDLVLALHKNPDEKNAELVKRERLVWVGNSNIFKANNEVIPLVVAPQGCIYRDRALKALKKAKIKSKITYVAPDLSGIEAAVGEGLGVTVLAKNTVPDSLVVMQRQGNFPSLGEIGISLLFDRNKASEATRRLSSYLRSNLNLR